ncbi:MAG TPA: UDP-N-acetylmuramoyl-L-alanine--D-glutamate ligase, partial [Candidatus Saccharimonadia bacterium]
TEVIAQAVRNFRGLPFRLEPVAEIDGVRYINDSFSVNQYATIAAINSFEPAHEVLILGGYKRGIDLRPMTEAVAKARPRQVVVLGQTGMQIKDQLEVLGYRHVVHGGSSMTGVVAAARSAARPGDVVLLSPGCPSFDMFKDYKDRGRQFAQAVQALLQKGQPA